LPQSSESQWTRWRGENNNGARERKSSCSLAPAVGIHANDLLSQQPLHVTTTPRVHSFVLMHAHSLAHRPMFVVLSATGTQTAVLLETGVSCATATKPTRRTHPGRSSSGKDTQPSSSHRHRHLPHHPHHRLALLSKSSLTKPRRVEPSAWTGRHQCTTFAPALATALARSFCFLKEVGGVQAPTSP
jgi:hypothetical protein